MINQNKILFVFNDHRCKDLFRSIGLSNFSAEFILKPNTALSLLKQQNFPLILIDESCCKYCGYKALLSFITSMGLGSKTLILTNEITQATFLKYIKLGLTYITDVKTAKAMVPAILEHLQDFSLKRASLEAIRYKEMILYPTICMVHLKNCNIHLSPKSTHILRYLIFTNETKTAEAIQQYLSYTYQKSISRTYVTVAISRLNKTIKAATGLRIVKNRYGIGYYLAL